MPLTKDKPKCMIDICGLPVIEWNISTLRKLGFTDKDIIIIYGYKGDTIKEYYSNNDITFIKQDKLTGTSDAVDLVKDYVDENFIVLAGDTIYFKRHIELLMIEPNSLLYTSHYKNLSEFGTIEFKDHPTDLYIKEIHEKKSKPIGNKINISGYYLNKDIFDYIENTPSTNGERYITSTINLMIKDKHKFRGIEVRDWNHISYTYDVERVQDNFWRRIRYDGGKFN